jgi:hypothetical protein
MMERFGVLLFFFFMVGVVCANGYMLLTHGQEAIARVGWPFVVLMSLAEVCWIAMCVLLVGIYRDTVWLERHRHWRQ